VITYSKTVAAIAMISLVSPAVAPAQSCSSDLNCVDGSACTRDVCVDQVCSNTAQVYGDVNDDDSIDLSDILCVIDAFSGVFQQCAPHAVDIAPCIPDESFDLSDVLAVLDAFRGVDACCGCGLNDDGLACDDDDACTLSDACSGGLCDGVPIPACGVSGGLTAYRPQHGSAYFPFSRTAVPDSFETHSGRGPGIRVNGPDDDPQGEDDLIEVVVAVDPPGALVALRRTDARLTVWTTRTKTPGTQISFVADRTQSLPLPAGGQTLTLWVEWTPPGHGQADLTLEPLATTDVLDALTFHTFRSVVMSLGGETQAPSVPVDQNHGTFVVGISLYQLGYDVHMYDEDNVAFDGSGPVYNEVVTAIQHREATTVGIFGYSHGGGSTYDLADRLDVNRAGIGTFTIEFTSYADGVSNDSDIDVFQENRRPPSTAYHANQFQVGSLGDFFLDGGPVPNSNPGPSGLNVESTTWGAASSHYDVDDYIQVRDYIQNNLVPRLIP
jgi:hypothetical protein